MHDKINKFYFAYIKFLFPTPVATSHISKIVSDYVYWNFYLFNFASCSLLKKTLDVNKKLKRKFQIKGHAFNH